MTSHHSNKIHRESENILALAQDLGLERLEWTSRPTEVEFGFNNHCNLLCVMCHQADGIPSKRMPPALAAKVLEQVLPFALHLTPSDASEPLMNDMDAVLAFCEKHDVQMLLYCNGTLLDEALMERIARHTHRIWFSIDSPVKETFEALRVNADFETVLENIRAALPIARKHHIEIGFNAVVMEPNWHQMPDLVDLVADLGGDQMSLQELLPNSTGYDELRIEGKVDDETYGAMVEGVRLRARERGVNVSLHLHAPFGGELVNRPADPASKAPLAQVRELHMDSLAKMHGGFCPMAMNYVKITPDGKVYPCCRGPEELEMGNVLETSFDEVWNGPAYREFRRRMHSGEYPDVCSTCLVLTGNPHFPADRRAGDAARTSP
ncbi:MAG: SPASM domain-containing protein [Planctomycetes bacterium]|nr:SPASM domain-containing protein [Planctomycetota bacterium]